MAVDPKDNISKKVVALPIDANNQTLPALIAAIVDGTTKEIIGYLPLKVTDNTDGTATLVTSGGGGGGVDPVGLKNIAAAPINPSTEDTLATRASEATLAAAAASLVSLDASVDVALSTRATEATLATRASEATLATLATEITLAAILGALASIDADIDVPLSTRATEATLFSIDGKVATETTLGTRASETTLGTRASEATLATRASETTLGTRASEATLATRATEATLDTVKDNTGLDDKTKIYEQTITVATTYNLKADMDTKFVVTGATVRSVTVRVNKDVTAEINADGETLTIEANTPFTIDKFNLTSIKLTPTMSTNVKILATGFGGV